MKTTSSSTGHALEEQVQAMLNQWIKPCFRTPYENIVVSANDQGEVRLHGVVSDVPTVEEAIRLIKKIPGVRLVLNQVVVVVRGHAVRL